MKFLNGENWERAQSDYLRRRYGVGVMISLVCIGAYGVSWGGFDWNENGPCS